jgi:hypothetical protein
MEHSDGPVKIAVVRVVATVGLVVAKVGLVVVTVGLVVVTAGTVVGREVVVGGTGVVLGAGVMAATTSMATDGHVVLLIVGGVVEPTTTGAVVGGLVKKGAVEGARVCAPAYPTRSRQPNAVVKGTVFIMFICRSLSVVICEEKYTFSFGDQQE